MNGPKHTRKLQSNTENDAKNTFLKILLNEVFAQKKTVKIMFLRVCLLSCRKKETINILK